MSDRRKHGQGSLYQLNGAWYGHWRANGRQVKRKLGPARQPGEKTGMTEKQAETELRRLIVETVVPRAIGEPLNVSEVSLRYRVAAERKGRKRSTIMDIESHTRVHFEPFFGAKAMASITPEDVQDLVYGLEERLSAKTVRNVIGTLSALFNFAKRPRNRWAAANPCEGVDIAAGANASEIRFLKLSEVDALVAHARAGMFREIDRALYLAAAMTGMRKGELLALRWGDVDWQASRVRVRQNYVRGEFGTPKSKRSTRSIPLADAVAGELHRLWQGSRFQGDDDLVFAHPVHGGPIPKANVTRRMKKTMLAAGLDAREYVFHDLRHTFGTRCAAAGTPMRTLQEWMGHKDFMTTMIYADFSPAGRDAEDIARAFGRAGKGEREPTVER